MAKAYSHLGLIAIALTAALAIAQTKPDELWKDHFNEVYGLAPSELVKHVLPPFIDERLELYAKVDPHQAAQIPEGPDAMVLEWRDDGPHMQSARFGGAL